MPPRQPRANAVLRFLAFAVFALFALTAALICLWLAFPRWGMSPNQVYFFYVAPQGFAAALVLGLALLVDVVAGVAALIVAVARQQRNWALTFLTAASLAVQAPLLLTMSTTNDNTVSLSPHAQLVSGIMSAAAFLLLPVLALIYARRRPASHINGIS